MGSVGHHRQNYPRAKACSNSARYTATKPPNCNGGRPCEACQKKWAAAQGKDPERKLRKCLTCGNPFMSEHVGNRRCASCKAGDDTRAVRGAAEFMLP